jgi:hypothetical protein
MLLPGCASFSVCLAALSTRASDRLLRAEPPGVRLEEMMHMMPHGQETCAPNLFFKSSLGRGAQEAYAQDGLM